jgi:hypothetical protein
MFDNLHCWHAGKQYPLSCNVDDEALPEPIIYEITVWDAGQPIDIFTPDQAMETALRVAALDAVETAYGLNPVLVVEK